METIDIELGDIKHAFEPDPLTTIFPTGTCFDDAPDFFMFLVSEDQRNGGLWVIVHGICLSPDDDQPFAHAWLESFQRVMDGGIYKGEKIMIEYPKDEFYSQMRVQECTRYLPDEWIMMNNQTEHYGPWIAKYKELCKK